jgi:hypothetical protein
MTEEEWLACRDPAPMIEFLRGPRIVSSEVLRGNRIEVYRGRDEAVNARKMRLFACACCRRIEHLVTPARIERAIGKRQAAKFNLNCCLRMLELSECYADGNGDPGGLESLRGAVHDAISAVTFRRVDPRSAQEHEATVMAAFAVKDTCEQEFFWLARVAGKTRSVVAQLRTRAGTTGRASEREALETAAQIELLRDIFGNPFNPIAFSPDWRTDTAVALARQMYESREFSAMPILAGALQDAGCGDEHLLAHCRVPGPHARGCWVVDRVLARE